MNRPTSFALSAVAAIALLPPLAARADEPTPLLAQLNHETRSLYVNVQAGLVRLQLPAPRWLTEMADADDPLKKWGQVLSPAVKAEVNRQRQEVEQGTVTRLVPPRVIPATQPKGGETPADAWDIGQMSVNGTIVIQSRQTSNP